jgi:hypothetical protein
LNDQSHVSSFILTQTEPSYVIVCGG